MLCLLPTDEYQKRQCQDHLKTNLKFMTSVRSTVPKSVTQQVCLGVQAIGRDPGVIAKALLQDLCGSVSLNTVWNWSSPALSSKSL